MPHDDGVVELRDARALAGELVVHLLVHLLDGQVPGGVPPRGGEPGPDGPEREPEPPGGFPEGPLVVERPGAGVAGFERILVLLHALVVMVLCVLYERLAGVLRLFQVGLVLARLGGDALGVLRG